MTGIIIAICILVIGFCLGWMARSAQVVRTRSHNQDFLHVLEKRVAKKMMRGYW